ncbi:MAG: metalloregulator ArsR/SmtB family transcription factor [Proteobacteria bacterium]|nr:metalloregulator ArsR/SmtB family transcription factor [Pseudomonadota bacterium]
MYHYARMNKNDAIEKSLNQIDNDFIKALAEPVRIEILRHLIANGSSDVKSLAMLMPQDRSVISRHLVLMHKAGLLKLVKDGRHVIYSVDAETALNKSEQIVASIRECIQYGCC